VSTRGVDVAARLVTCREPTPAFAQTLPDDAEGLRAYLDPKVFGSSSHSEALFEALTSLATSHTLPPPTLAAAYEALADIDNVRTSDVHIDGSTERLNSRPGPTPEEQAFTPLASRLVTTLVVAGPRSRWSEAENEAEAAVDVVHQVTGQLPDSCGVFEVRLVERDEGCDVD